MWKLLLLKVYLYPLLILVFPCLSALDWHLTCMWIKEWRERSFSAIVPCWAPEPSGSLSWPSAADRGRVFGHNCVRTLNLSLLWVSLLKKSPEAWFGFTLKRKWNGTKRIQFYLEWHQLTVTLKKHQLHFVYKEQIN